MTTGQTEDQIDKLLAGEIHVAVTRLSQHPEVDSLHLYNDDLALVVAPNHPFAKKGNATIAEVGKEPFLFFERGSSYHSLVYSMFLRAGVVPESVMELDLMEATKYLVEAGLGVSILPEISIKRELETGTLVQVEIHEMEQPAQREVGVHVLRGRILAPPIQDFLALLADDYGVENTFKN
jgi:DNA-binding transcriptional LysR family regulator